MSQSLRDLRQKIKGVKATRQVTKAMELVSAAKMRKAIQNATVLRRYSLTAWNILQRIASGSSDQHPAMQERPVVHVLVILFTSDRGLAGNLNAQMTRTVAKELHQLQSIPTFKDVSFIAVGRKGQQYLSRTGQMVKAAFPAFSNRPTFRDILPVARLALEGFNQRTYDHVYVLYAGFVSPLLQQPTARVLLPLSRSELKDMLSGMQRSNDSPDTLTEANVTKDTLYKFEPSVEKVLEAILPQFTELQIYHGLLEATASEHSARMVAMHNASENASDLIDDLTLTYNRTRQEKITGELAELSASKAALDTH